MNRRDGNLSRFAKELRRRGTFRTAGLYIVGAWLVMQAADVFFPGWGLPDAAINVLLTAAILGFPLALVFGWFYDVTLHGIVRTPSVPEVGATAARPLQRADFLILGALVLVAGLIVYDAIRDILDAPQVSVTPMPDADFVPTEERPENSIAVLPFANISDDPANEFFCDGISEEILNRLSGFEGLFVMARTSSFAFKGSDFGVRRIGGILGVRYLLQGSVRKYGDQLRISAQLVDESGAQRWSETFDRSLENVFEIQSEIAELVSTTIQPKITARPARAFEPSTEAYGRFLAGRELLRLREVPAARQELRNAVELEPGYAEAHAELAIAYLIGLSPLLDLDAATAAIDTALSLQPGLPRALAARGLYLQQKRDRDWAGSAEVLQRVLEADPNMVDAMNWLSSALSVLGREAESDAIQLRAYEIDPLNPVIVSNMSARLAGRGEVDRAERMLLRLTELPRTSYLPFMNLRTLYLRSGQLVKMNRIAKREALTGHRLYFGLQLNYALLGRWQMAEEWVRLTNRDFPDHWYAGFNLANVPTWRGEYSKAIRLLEEASSSSHVAEEDYGYIHYLHRGCARALAGEHAEAVAILENPRVLSALNFNYDYELLPHHCLAWSYFALGERDKVAPLLETVEAAIRTNIRGEPDPSPYFTFLMAMNALLDGNHELAIERLGQAVEAGWRGYYVHINDPRWTVLADDPRFIQLMSEVKADVDRQAAEVDQIDAEEDFIAILEATRAERRAARE